MQNSHPGQGTEGKAARDCLDEGLYPHGADVVIASRTVFMSCPCRDDYTGSLYPLPPGQCRHDVFCGHCAAPACLFGGTPAQRRLRLTRRAWSMPDVGGVDTYIGALKLYSKLLRQERTCWYCTHLRQLRGPKPRFVCEHNTRLTHSRPAVNGELPSLSATGAKLLTAVEGCDGAHYERRSGPRPIMPATLWLEMLAADGERGCCADCLHIRSLVVAERVRFVCALEADSMAPPLAWRLARSWRVVQMRRGGAVWCRGNRWCPRLDDVGPLSVAVSA